MAKKTDLIRVSRNFADALRKASEERGETMIDITADINLSPKKKKRRSGDPFDITVI